MCEKKSPSCWKTFWSTNTQLVSSAEPAIMAPSMIVRARPAIVGEPVGSRSSPAAASGTARR